MNKLLQKYEEFIDELEHTITDIMQVEDKESYTTEELVVVSTFTAACSVIMNNDDLYKRGIHAIGDALEYFKLEEGE